MGAGSRRGPLWWCEACQFQGSTERENTQSPMEDASWVCFHLHRFSTRRIIYTDLECYSYSPPFDRHDWVVDRCGTRVRYIIDFYTGRGAGLAASNLSFYLDVRPALDNWEGVRLRTQMFWHRWTDGLWSSPASTPTPPKSTTSS